MSGLDLDAIRARCESEHKLFAAITPAPASGLHIPKAVQAHTDRVVLLAEVDRLAAELAEARDDYDAACRSVGRPLRGGTSTDGGAA